MYPVRNRHIYYTQNDCGNPALKITSNCNKLKIIATVLRTLIITFFSTTLTWKEIHIAKKKWSNFKRPHRRQYSIFNLKFMYHSSIKVKFFWAWLLLTKICISRKKIHIFLFSFLRVFIFVIIVCWNKSMEMIECGWNDRYFVCVHNRCEALQNWIC